MKKIIAIAMLLVATACEKNKYGCEVRDETFGDVKFQYTTYESVCFVSEYQGAKNCVKVREPLDESYNVYCGVMYITVAHIEPVKGKGYKVEETKDQK